MKFVYSSGARPLDGYTIKRGIGIGGFGEVYFATSDGGKEVALKRIQRNLDIELRGVRQCLNLKHINLIDLYDIRYDHDGGAWVVMEFVSGESMKDVVDRNPNGLPIDEVKRWFRGMVQGVGCLHDHGIVHRDLKPANIFSDNQTVKIGDYGLSKFISCSRRSGQTESVGTFHYMAPEIGKGVYGKEIDVYAMGIILFELLTGRVPFEGESTQEIIMKHLTADPEVDDIAEPYRTVICRALEKDPDRRYSNVYEMVAALDGKSGEAVASTGSSGTDQVVDAIVDDIHVVSDNIPPADEAEYQLQAEPPTPPSPPIRSLVGQAGRQRGSARDTFFITEEGAGDGMVFGPVRQGASSPGRPTPRQALGRPTSTPRPPVAMAGRSTLTANQASAWATQYATPLKVVVLVLACFLIAMTRSPVVVVLACLGLLAFAGRSLATAGANTTAAIRAHSQLQREARKHLHRQRHRQPFGETLSDLLGALLFSAGAAAVVCLLAVALADLPLDGSIHTWSIYLWITLTTTFGAWLVLATGKCWECHEGDGWLRRFVMLSAGLGLGIAAYGGAQFLGVTFDRGGFANVSPLLDYQAWYQNGQPMLPAFLAYFGGIFGVMRWWGQVDPLRPSRLNLISTSLCVLWAWILHTMFYFPQPWGVVLAGTISVAAQLAAPWLSPNDRSQIQENYQEAVS